MCRREELAGEIKSLSLANKRLQDTVEHLNSDIRQQTSKYRENEKKLNEVIAYLEVQAKSIQTEEFKKLKDDNKALIDDNMRLSKETQSWQDQTANAKLEVREYMATSEALKQNLETELCAIKGLKAKLAKELELVKLQKYVRILFAGMNWLQRRSVG